MAEIRRVRRRDHGARVVNVSGLITLSAPPPMHATGWNVFDWCFHVFWALFGWASVAGAVYWMYRVESQWVDQPQLPPAFARASEYALVIGIGLGGAFLAVSFGWIVERHLASMYWIFVWLFGVPAICIGAVLVFWRRTVKPGLDTGTPEGKRTKTDSAVWAAVLVYGVIFVIIAGADAITRLAAEVDLPTDTVIFLVLIGILGWVFWVYSPRRLR